jgi:hypothetical protein
MRFSKLHEKRAEIIAELYSRAVELQKKGGRYVLQIGGQEPEEQFEEVRNTMYEFHDFFDKHRIYLPERACSVLSAFDDAVTTSVFRFHHYSEIKVNNVYGTTPGALKQRDEAIRGAYQALERSPQPLKALEDAFRTILGEEIRSGAAGK